MLWEALSTVAVVVTIATGGAVTRSRATRRPPPLSGVALAIRTAKDAYVADRIDIPELEHRVQFALEASAPKIEGLAVPTAVDWYAVEARTGIVWPPM